MTGMTESPTMTPLQAILDALRGPQRKCTVILLSSTFLMLAWKYYGSPEALAARFSGSDGDARAAGAIAGFFGSFLLLGVLPALVVKFLFRERLADYGVGLGVASRTWRSLAVAAPLFVAAAWSAATDPEILAKFPINPQAGTSSQAFALHAATYLLFYAGWEFHFRGFLLFGLRPAIGDANAVLLQAMASALLHIGSPAAETFGSILGGILWGVVALRTRSLLSSLGQHFLLGIALDAFICAGRR